MARRVWASSWRTGLHLKAVRNFDHLVGDVVHGFDEEVTTAHRGVKDFEVEELLVEGGAIVVGRSPVREVAFGKRCCFCSALAFSRLFRGSVRLRGRADASDSQFLREDGADGVLDDVFDDVVGV